jgi:hypothetical protein
MQRRVPVVLSSLVPRRSRFEVRWGFASYSADDGRIETDHLEETETGLRLRLS